MAATTSGDPVTRSGGGCHAVDHGRNGLGPECRLSRGVLVPIGPGLCFRGEKMKQSFLLRFIHNIY